MPLSFSQSFSSCVFSLALGNGNDLWEGIFVPGGKQGYFAECYFSNAITAIKGFNGSFVLARSSVFYNNKTGIYMLESQNGSDNHSTLIANSNEFYSTPNGINDAFVGNRSYAAMIVNDMAYPDITDANYIHDIQNGILLYNSTLHFYNNTYDLAPHIQTNVYKNIQPAPGNQYASESGIGLLVDGGLNGNSKIWLDGGTGYDLSYFNYSTNYNFENCKVGIKSVNANLTLRYNDFKDCERAILVVGTNNPASSCDIEKNTILNSFVGIDMLDNPSGPSGIIYKNNITGGALSVNGNGIRALNSLSFGASTMVIKENSINVNRNGMEGITSSGVELLTMYGNQIQISGQLYSYKGIHILNASNNNFLAENDITGGGGGQWFDNISPERNGIKIEGCMQTDIGCNNVIGGVASGLQILDDCSNSSIYRNKFNTCTVGLLYGTPDPSGYPGQSSPQYGQLNEWTGGFSKYPAWYSINFPDPSWIYNSEYNAVPKPSIYHPINIKSEDPNDPWFFATQGGSPQACKTALLGNNDGVLSTKEINIINGVPGNLPTDQAHYWNTRWNLYNRLKRSSNLNTSATINNYIISESSSNLGKLFASWSMVRNFQGFTLAQQNTYAIALENLDSVEQLLQNLYEQADAEYVLSDSISLTTENAIQAGLTSARQYKSELFALGGNNNIAWNQAISNAQNILSNISTTNDQEGFQKNIQSIYLASLANHQRPNTGQLNDILSIANDCPNEKGQAVWWARNIYKIVNQLDTTQFIKWCQPSHNRSSLQNEAAISNVEIMPNPGSDILTINNLDISKSYEIEMFSTYGIKVKNINCSKKQSISLDTNQLQDGMYIVHIIQGDKIVNKTWIKQSK